MVVLALSNFRAEQTLFARTQSVKFSSLKPPKWQKIHTFWVKIRFLKRGILVLFLCILAIDNIISYHIISYYSFHWRKVGSDFFIFRALFMLVAPSGSAKAKDLLPVVAVGLGDPGVIHGSVFWNAMKEPPDLLFVDVLSFGYYVRLSIIWFVCVCLEDMEYPSWTTTHIIHVCILTCYMDGLCS